MNETGPVSLSQKIDYYARMTRIQREKHELEVAQWQDVVEELNLRVQQLEHEKKKFYEEIKRLHRLYPEHIPGPIDPRPLDFWLFRLFRKKR